MDLSRSAAMLVAAGAIGLGPPAGAQTIHGGYEFRVSNVVSPSQPTATVEVWAWFDFVPGVSELFAGGDFDLVASEGEWLRDSFAFPLSLPDPGPGVTGSTIVGVSASQFHLPALGFFGDPANPIHVFSGDWTTTDFTARTVSVVTENTSIFGVYSQAGALTMIPPSSVVPGSSSIFVVPSPASLTAAVITFATCSITRCRRRV